MHPDERPDSVGQDVLFTVTGQVATVLLNRPERRNAINGGVTRALRWIVDQVEQSSAIAVVVLGSSTPGMFCAGADLAEIARGGGADLVDQRYGFAGFVRAQKSKPWIAAVDGPAMGGGFELALSCDMIIASNNALFGLPEVKRGLMAMAGGAIRLPRLLPRALAMEALLTGDPITPGTAQAHGLINTVVAPEDVLPSAIDLAERVARNAPIALRESLALAQAASIADEGALWTASDAAMLRVASSEDAREGPRAFIEKREPNWSGR
jgi:enoyl-CoA hydratase/carnithine racemase